MTISSELRGHAHKHRISHTLSLVNRMVRWERFTQNCTLVARVEVHTDTELRELLDDCSDFWEFDVEEMTLYRKNNLDDSIRMEIGVNGLEAEHVWKLISITEPAW